MISLSILIMRSRVMLDELVHRCPEMSFPQRNHPIQALLLNRSCEPRRVTVRRLERRLHYTHGGFLHQVAFRSAPLPIRSQIRTRQWASAPSSSAVIVRAAWIMNASFGCGGSRRSAPGACPALNDEHGVACHESPPRPHFGREEICRRDLAPMGPGTSPRRSARRHRRNALGFRIGQSSIAPLDA